MVLYTLHLFSGAGGGILADLLLGNRPIGAVEIEQYPRDVLLRHQLTGELPNFPIWDDVRSFSIDNDATRPFIERLCGIREQLCISGGFPCTNISAAGKGEGISGKESGLWKEFARIVREIRPRYVFLENSNLLVRRGLDVVLSDLAEMGYSLAWGIISAADVGAPHLRKRFWGLAISDSLRDREGRNGSVEEVARDKSERERERERERVNANSNSAREQGSSNRKDNEQTQFRPDELRRSISDALRSWSIGRQRERQEDKADGRSDGRRETLDGVRQRRDTQSRLGRVPDGLDTWLDANRLGTLWNKEENGIPRLAAECKNRAKRLKNRAKRLKAIGNGQVPLCAAVAFVTLKEILDNYDC